MAACVFSLADDLRVVAPVPFSVPVSAKTNGVKTEQSFIKKTIYLEFRVPLEDELDDLQAEILTHNTETARKLDQLAKDEAAAAGDAAALAAIDVERVALTGARRNFQTDALARFVTGLPDGHGVGDESGELAVHSGDLIHRMCQRRFLRSAMWDAFTKLLNGEGKRGN
jgi:hypothetical protein